MERRTQTDRLRRTLTAAERVVPWLALVAAPLGLFLLLRSQREAIAMLDSIGWDAIAPSALAFMLAPLLQGVSFWIVLRLFACRTSLLDAMVVWSRSYIVRYVPTGTLAVAYRLSARRRLGASADQVLAGFTYEHVGVLVAAAAACLALFALAGDLPPLLPLAIALAALVLAAALRPGIAGRGVEALTRRLGLQHGVILEGRQLATVVAVNVLGWLGTGTAVYLFVTTVTGSAPPFLWLAGTYTAGYLVGFVAPLSPGGLGVREGMLVVLLAPHYGMGVAIALPIAIRLVNIAGELLAVALVHAVYVVHTASTRMGGIAAEVECTAAAEPVLQGRSKPRPRAGHARPLQELA